MDDLGGGWLYRFLCWWDEHAAYLFVIGLWAIVGVSAYLSLK